MSKIAAGQVAISQMAMHHTMTEMNHLGRNLLAKPEKLEGPMTQIFTSKKYSDNPMTSLLTGMKAEKTIGTMSWEWDLKGASSRPGIVVEDVIPRATTKPGAGKTLFEIKLDSELFVPGDIIHPGPKELQSRIQDAPYEHGDGWIYKVRLMDDRMGAFVHKKYMQPGSMWGKLYSQYEEASEQSGSTNYAMPRTLTGRLSRYRKHYKVTGDAANEVLATRIADSKGKMHDMWIKYAEVEYWQQWYRELERGYWYSRKTNTVKGANGRPLFTGAGIQQQLEDSNTHRYSVLTAKLLEEFLMDIMYSRVKPGSPKRKIKGFTGEYGMLQFHNAVTEAAKNSGFITVHQHFIKTTKSDYNSNGLQFGGQFTKYVMSNGLELELIHNPLYDDQDINFELDPVTGKPKESLRYTFLDFSGEGKNSNIKLMHRKGGFKHWYVAGGQNPYGAVTNGLGSHAGDYYEIHVLKQCGLHIHDVTKCGELILERQTSI